jgi:hypothetical protein
VANHPSTSIDKLGRQSDQAPLGNPPAEPSPNSPTQEVIEHANDAFGIWKDAVEVGNFESLAPESAAWVEAIGMNLFEIGYGIAVSEIGNKLEADARQIVLCDLYRNIRFNQSTGNASLDQAELIQRANPGKRQEALNAIAQLPTDIEQAADTHFGYAPFVYTTKEELFFLIWLDESSGERTTVSVAQFRSDFTKEKFIRPGKQLVTTTCACNNGLVKPYK